MSEFDIHNYINEVLSGFLRDPADSDSQRGYLAAIVEIADQLQIFVPQELRSQCKSSV